MDKDIRNMLIVCGMVIGAAILIITASYLIIGHNDGRPDWANDTASHLDEKGGTIVYYANAIRDYSGASPTASVNVSVAEKVYANKDGIIIKNGNNIVQIPYDRVYAIYITP